MRRLAIRGIEADLVDCMVVLLGLLYYSTQILFCFWFLAKNKAAEAKRGSRDRRKQTLSTEGNICRTAHPNRWHN